MLIGILSKQAGVPTKTIRYYEEVGLLVPPVRRSSGYREYDESALARLRFIRAAQSIGLSLGEIREVLAFRDRGEAPCGYVGALIEEHAANLDRKIAEMERIRGELRRLARRARTVPRVEPAGACFCHIIEGRRAAVTGGRK